MRRITVHRPTLRVTHRPDGAWSAVKLLPPPQFGDRPPEVVVETAAIEIFDPRTPASAPPLRDVNLSLVPLASTEPGFTPDTRQLKAAFTGDGFRGLEFEGLVDLRTPAFSIRGHIETLEISPELSRFSA